MKNIFVLILLLPIFSIAGVQPCSIAVTIDDLPVVSTRTDLKNRQEITRKLLGHIKAVNIPAIGFVNENKLYADGKRDEAQIDLLRMWLDAGLELGNHTFSHQSADAIGLEEYENDILKGEIITKELLKTKKMDIRYFRHPYLRTATDLERKKAIYAFLAEHNYRVAPISFDNGDYIFSNAYDRAFDKNDKNVMKRIGKAYVTYMTAKLGYWQRQADRLFGRQISQTMLIHANFINAEYLDDLARVYKKLGCKFVSLDDALKDEAYLLPDNYTKRGGISWLHRWALDRGKEYIEPNEPLVPDFVLKASAFTSE